MAQPIKIRNNFFKEHKPNVRFVLLSENERIVTTEPYSW